MLVTSANSKLHACKSGNSKILKEKVFTDVSFYRTYAMTTSLVTETDSIALIVRHSQKAGNGDAHLSTKGEEWAIEQGEVLSNLPAAFKNDVKYYSTNTNRTKETAIKLSYGMTGTAITENDIDLSLANGILRSNYYLRGSNPGNPDWTLLSKYAYNIVSGEGALTAQQLMDNFGTTAENNLEKINLYTSEIVNCILSNMTNKTNIFITHDNMLGPFVVTVTGMTINMDYYQNPNAEWVNYISGILLIKHIDGSFECIPIHTPYNDNDVIYTRVTSDPMYSDLSWFRWASYPASEMSETDKLVLIVRHAERGSDTSKQGDLDETGISQATSAADGIIDGHHSSATGKDVDIDANDVTYHSTDYIRCEHTAQLIAAARGDTDWDASDYSEIDITDALPYIEGNAFIANPENLPSSGTHELIQKYCYNPSQLDPDTELSAIFNTTMDSTWDKIQNDAINFIKHILGLSTARLNVFITHDHYVAPMLAYTIGNTHSSYATAEWPDYLYGVAIVLHTDNSYDILPIKMKD